MFAFGMLVGIAWCAIILCLAIVLDRLAECYPVADRERHS